MSRKSSEYSSSHSEKKVHILEIDPSEAESSDEVAESYSSES